MATEKSGISDYFSSFSLDEINQVVTFLRGLESHRTVTVEKFLKDFSEGVLLLSGFSAVRSYFDLAWQLSIESPEKRNIVYETLKRTSTRELLDTLCLYLEHRNEEEVVRQIKSEPFAINYEKELPQTGPVVYKSRLPEPVGRYYPIDDEEYTVKSKYVYPSPTGVEEGYPPLVKKKKKPRN